MKRYALVFAEAHKDPILVTTGTYKKMETEATRARAEFHGYRPGISDVAWYIGYYDSKLSRHENALEIVKTGVKL